VHEAENQASRDEGDDDAAAHLDNQQGQYQPEK
jgi:hypothetical protein